LSDRLVEVHDVLGALWGRVGRQGSERPGEVSGLRRGGGGVPCCIVWWALGAAWCDPV